VFVHRKRFIGCYYQKFEKANIRVEGNYIPTSSRKGCDDEEKSF
jgi:hypothetical protein